MMRACVLVEDNRRAAKRSRGKVYLHKEFPWQRVVKLTTDARKVGRWPVAEACFFAGIMTERGYGVVVQVEGDPCSGVRA